MMKFVRVHHEDEERKQAIFVSPKTENYYLYSYINSKHAHETMVFECDKDGLVYNWSELASRDGYANSVEIMEDLKDA